MIYRTATLGPGSASGGGRRYAPTRPANATTCAPRSTPAAALESARDDLRARAERAETEAERARGERDQAADQAADAEASLGQLTSAAAAAVTACEQALSDQDNEAVRSAVARRPTAWNPRGDPGRGPRAVHVSYPGRTAGWSSADCGQA